MNSRIQDNIRLLGLIVTTIPFEYNDNIVTSSYNGYIEINELEQMKSNIQTELDSNTFNDTEKEVLVGDIYFLEQIIEFLKTKI